jgi:hypothetical protein
MFPRKFRLLAILLCFGVNATAYGAARGLLLADAEQSPPTLRQAGGVSLDQAIAIVQAKYNARVMRANTVEEDGRLVHYIRLMSADRSRVWTVRVDAATGREF